MNRMALQAPSTLDGGRQVVHDAAMQFHLSGLKQIGLKRAFSFADACFGWKADTGQGTQTASFALPGSLVPPVGHRFPPQHDRDEHREQAKPAPPMVMTHESNDRADQSQTGETPVRDGSN